MLALGLFLLPLSSLTLLQQGLGKEDVTEANVEKVKSVVARQEESKVKTQWVNRDNLVKAVPVPAVSRRSQPPLLVLSGTILPMQ